MLQLTRRAPALAAQLSMRVDEFCSASCMLGPLSEEVAAAFRAKIDDEYRVNMCARGCSAHHPARAWQLECHHILTLAVLLFCFALAL